MRNNQHRVSCLSATPNPPLCVQNSRTEDLDDVSKLVESFANRALQNYVCPFNHTRCESFWIEERNGRKRQQETFVADPSTFGKVQRRHLALGLG